MKRYTVSPNNIDIISNVDYIPRFFLGPYLFHFPQPKPSEIEIYFKVVKRLATPQKLDRSLSPFSVGKNIIYYDIPFLRVFRPKVMILDLHQKPKILMNETYYRITTRCIGNLLSSGDICTDIIWAKLVERSMCLTHASCISLDNNGILILGHSGTGKSSVAYLSERFGFQFLSEDITIFDERKAYSCPFTRSFLHTEYLLRTLLDDKKINKKVFFKMMFLKRFENFSKFLPLKIFTTPIIYKRPLREDFQNEVKIKKIFIIEHGNNSISELDKEETIKKILLFNHMRFHFNRDVFLAIYSFHNSDFEYEKLLEKGKEIIVKLVENSNCFTIRADNPMNCIKLISRLAYV